MAPELLETGQRQPRSDVYALGAFLYELTTGTELFFGHGADALQKAISEGDIRAPSEVCSDYPEALEDIVMRALACRPLQRYPDCRQLQLALEAFSHMHAGAPSARAVADLMHGLFVELSAGVEPDGFESQATRVFHYDRSSELSMVQTNRASSVTGFGELAPASGRWRAFKEKRMSAMGGFLGVSLAFCLGWSTDSLLRGGQAEGASANLSVEAPLIAGSCSTAPSLEEQLYHAIERLPGQHPYRARPRNSPADGNKIMRGPGSHGRSMVGRAAEQRRKKVRRRRMRAKFTEALNRGGFDESSGVDRR